MVACKWCALGLVVLGSLNVGTRVWATEAASLRESVREGATTQVLTTLRAVGFLRPGVPPGSLGPKVQAPRPLSLKVETRLDCAERVLVIDAQGRPMRVARRVRQAAAAINGEVRPMAAVLRPEVALLIAEPRAGKVVVYSPGGPLTRAELEVAQNVGDSLVLPDLLPDHPVTVGDRWRVGDDAVRGLSGYDVLAGHGLEATLEALEDDEARVQLAGKVRGAVFGGGDGTMTCDGSLRFDRKSGLVSKLSLRRDEDRKPGEVEEGIELKSTLTVDRRPAATPAALDDSALAGIPVTGAPEREQLLYVSPDGKYTLRHDRDWHIFQDLNRQTVLKRLDRGELVAHLNLTAGPNAGKGRHQDDAQFRSDIRKALGERFRVFLGQGEIEGDPAGGYRYKVGVQGRQGDLEIVWYYYLVASPEGDQLLATFTLADNQAKALGDQDVQIMGSLRWQPPAEK